MLDAIDIRPARGAADMAATRDIFQEYQKWLGFDLCFQGFDQELAELPGAYTAPAGEIFLAWDGEALAGAVAVRPVGDPSAGRCEMKRLFVRDAWRGLGLGRRLAMLVVDHARMAGYRSMVLDTLPKLERARQMYLKMGFAATEPYYQNPIPGTIYMEKLL